MGDKLTDVNTQAAFASRKEQIEKEFMRRLIRDANLVGLTRRQRNILKRTLRDAAMVGACEERSRTLELIRRYGPIVGETAITVVPILKVLGYAE